MRKGWRGLPWEGRGDAWDCLGREEGMSGDGQADILKSFLPL